MEISCHRDLRLEGSQTHQTSLFNIYELAAKACETQEEIEGRCEIATKNLISSFAADRTLFASFCSSHTVWEPRGVVQRCIAPDMHVSYG